MKLCDPRTNGSEVHALRWTPDGRGTPGVAVAETEGDVVGFGVPSMHAVSTSRESPDPAPRRKLRRLNDISAPLYSECSARMGLPRPAIIHRTGS
jgi:hypothetical protein